MNFGPLYCEFANLRIIIPYRGFSKRVECGFYAIIDIETEVPRGVKKDLNPDRAGELPAALLRKHNTGEAEKLFVGRV